MPYPAQINRDSIVQKALEMVGTDGPEKLSLHKLAGALGVKAPSLYRHIGNKNELLKAVNFLTLQNLFAAMDDATSRATGDAEEQMQALFAAYRAFAHAHPRLYSLAFSDNDDYRPDEDILVQMVLPVQALMAQICGDADSLAALRGAMALLHGFVILELTNQLRRGGDLDAAFHDSVAAYLRGWQ